MMYAIGDYLDKDQDKDVYLKLQAEAAQRSIVTYKSCSTPGNSSVVWTFRNTNCDVVAVITTTLPLLDGKMRDIKLNTTETMKLKPPMMKNGKAVPHNSPFMDGLIIDVERSRKRVSGVLKSERKSFLTKLKTTKYMRGALETRAAVLIQTAFRSHFVRTHIQEIVKDRIAKKMIIADMKKYFASQNVEMSLSSHRKIYVETRYKSARLIQSVFRKYISKKCLLRKRKEVCDVMRRNACMRIQCMFRRAIACHFVALKRKKRKFLKNTAAAVKIQCGFRRILAKRRVRLRRLKYRWLAARMIQCWFRARNSRKISAALKEFIRARRIYIGATRMQCLARKFMSIRRVNRIRFRRLYVTIFKAAASIQKIIRRYLSSFYINRYRASKAANEKQKKQLALLKEQADIQALRNMEVMALKENMNIFYQAYVGNVITVEDLFHEMKANTNISDTIERCTNSDTGDSLLSIAAEVGNLDLVRKCLLWGLDVNLRNYAGLNCLMIATKYHNINVVQYLLAYNSSSESEKPPNSVLEPILEDDAFTLLSFAISQPCTIPSHNYTLPKSATMPPQGPGKTFVLANLLINAGLSISVAHSETGMTPLLYACENGLTDGVAFLIKQRAATDAVDENGQTIYHKAAKSSASILKGLLGINDSFGINIPEGTRPSYLLKPDGNGKDCALLGAIHGQRGVLDMIHDLIKNTASNLLPAKYIAAAQSGQPPKIIFAPDEDLDVGWSPADISSVLTLATSNDAYCLSRVLEGGFDIGWAPEASGVRVVHMACKYGATDVIDLCFNVRADFAVTDSRNRNVLHYAATNSKVPLFSMLFQHPKAKECNMTEALLSSQEYDRGDTPVHTVAYVEGVDLSMDLLARAGLEAAMLVKNYSGMTPLMLACSFIRHQLVLQCLDFGADVKALDLKGRSAFWHLFHAVNSTTNANQATMSVSTGAKVKLRPPFCSELHARKGSRKDRDDYNTMLQKDIQVMVAMVKAGSSIFLPSSLLISVEKMIGLPQLNNGSRPSSSQRGDGSSCGTADVVDKSSVGQSPTHSLKVDSFAFTLPIGIITYANPVEELLDSGDVAAKEMSFSFLKIVTSLATPKECWRLVLSCLRFDEGSSKALLALLEGGVIDLLVQGDVNSPKKSQQHGKSGSKLNSYESQLSIVNMDERPNSSYSIPVAEMERLQAAFFGGNTLLGWSIKLGNLSALQQLSKRGYNAQLTVDMMGNSGLHLICSQSASNAGSMAEILLNDPRVRIESKNFTGMTPAMMCAKFSNIPVFKRLYNKGVDCRDGLRGKYVSWMLAFAKRKERNEINTQTGRYGSDDVTYFSVHPTPDYTWSVANY